MSILRLSDGRNVALLDFYMMRKMRGAWVASNGNGGPGTYERVEKFVEDLTKLQPDRVGFHTPEARLYLGIAMGCGSQSKQEMKLITNITRKEARAMGLPPHRITVDHGGGAGSNQAVTTTYNHGDHLGSARMSSGADGYPTWKNTYYPWGGGYNPQSNRRSLHSYPINSGELPAKGTWAIICGFASAVVLRVWCDKR